MQFPLVVNKSNFTHSLTVMCFVAAAAAVFVVVVVVLVFVVFVC